MTQSLGVFGTRGLPGCPWLWSECSWEMFVGWGKSRCWKYYWEQDPLSSLASLHRIFILFWELMLSLRRTLSQEAFVRLRWAERAVAEKCGERGNHVGRRRNNASCRGGLIVNLKEIPNCVR